MRRTLLQGHTEDVLCLAVPCSTADGVPDVISGGEDGTVRLWDTRTRRTAKAIVMPGRQAVISLACGAGPEAAHRIYAASDATVRCFDLRMGVEDASDAVDRVCVKGVDVTLHTVEEAADDVAAVTLSPKGDLLATSDDSGAVRVHRVADVQVGAAFQVPQLGHMWHSGQGQICSSAAFRSDRQLLTGGFDCSLVLWEAVNRKILHRHTFGTFETQAAYANPPYVHAVAVQEAVALIALGDGTVAAYDAASRKLLARKSGHRHSAAEATFLELSGKRQAVTAGNDMEVLLWELPGAWWPQKKAKKAPGGVVNHQPAKGKGKKGKRGKKRKVPAKQQVVQARAATEEATEEPATAEAVVEEMGIISRVAHGSKPNALAGGKGATFFLADQSADISLYTLQ